MFELALCCCYLETALRLDGARRLKMPKGDPDAEASARKHLLIFRFITFASLTSQTGTAVQLWLFSLASSVCSHSEYP